MKSCTVVTSIHPVNTVLRVLSNRSSDLIIVGDKKSPPSYDINCEYLDVKLQEEIPAYASLSLPFNHYSRKNAGYLNAILSGYDMIYDTDDDNTPLFEDGITFKFDEMVTASSLMINVYGLYTTKNIWSRGFPHSELGRLRSNTSFPTDKKPSIVYGLCDGDTDVDAIYRIVNKDIDIAFTGVPLVINNKHLIVFNSQSTFWVDPEVFVCMYLPVTVTSRFSDILRSYVTQYVLRSQNKFIGVQPRIAYQNRNAHNLYDDLQEEIFMYKTVDKLIFLLESLILSGSVYECLYTIYEELVQAHIVGIDELYSLENWINIIKNYQKNDGI